VAVLFLNTAVRKIKITSRYRLYAIQIVILAAVYFGAAKMGLSLASVKGIVTLVWPPTGIALAALLLGGYRLWPGIALGAFLVNLSAGASLAAVGISAGNTLEAVVGAYLLHRYIGFHNSMKRLRDVLGLVGLAAVVSPMVSATIGAASLGLGGIIPWTVYSSTWWVWWLGDALGALLVAPVLLTWGTDFHIAWRPARLLEAATLLLALVMVGQIVFSGWLASYIVTTAPLSFTLFPLLVWAALRFGQRGAVLTTLIGTGVVLWGTAHGFGPFVLETLHLSLVFLSGFIGTAAVTAMLLAAAISERQQVEAALRQSEARFAKLFHANPAAIVLSVPATGRFLDVNDSYLRLVGYNREEVVGRISLELGIWANPVERARIVEALRTHGAVRDMEITVRRKSGELRYGLTSAELIDLDGELCLLGMLHDITERKHLEEQLRQAQKMEAIGRLAGGVAHDFNNILTVIQGYTGLLLQELKAQDPLSNDIRQIQKSAERAAALTRQLLAFSRKQVLQPIVLDFNAVVTNMDQMLRRLIGEDINLMVCLEPGLGRVKADPGLIEQVLMNLAINAREAMPNGGRFTIETANVELDEEYTRLHLGVKPGPYIRLTLTDTGHGMDIETRSHIFEPFFTTKEQGTGLGLATVHGIIAQSGGHIWVYSEPGQGASFKVYLPRVEEEIGQWVRSNLLSVGPSKRGSETILLVEDEASVRELAHRALLNEGYTVLEAAHGEEAIRVAQQHQGAINLLVTDVVMPGGMSGGQLVERLSPLRPEMKVLYMSGYTDDAVVRYGILGASIAFLQKPFTPKRLASKVREVLDTGP
jgi:PAS domain S-box-containing protein